MKAPRVTLDQWRTLQAVVDHGGFAQAAEVLHRSQSSVSYTVARMQDQLGVPLLRIDGRKAVLTEAGGVLLRRSRQLVKQASQLEDLAHHMEQGWEAEVRLVVDAAYPNARLVRALTAFMPQSRGCRCGCAKKCCRVSKKCCSKAWPTLAISSFSIPGYLGAELSDVEFVAVAHPEHALHRLNRELTFQGSGEPVASGDPRLRTPATSRRGLARRRAALDRRQPGHRRDLRRQRPGLRLAAPAHD